ncbi:hypothetical protein C8R47DRAFT_1207891 [Mycena vitilis]|nr:hypothetical protein C8R47DRAFT_1207891 [Mycena vitilis]
MPLFGSSSNDNKHHGHNDLGAAGTGVGRTNETYPPPAGMNEPGMGQSGNGMGQGGVGHSGMGEPGAIGGQHHGHHNAGHAGGMRDDGMMGGAGTGTGMGTGTGAGNNTGMGGVGHGNEPHGSGGGSSMTGKIEHAVGSAIGSKSLQAKGLEKEQEAKALKIQSHEMAEAERLEHEAGVRRERAVAHGAHPDNRHVGGMGPGGAAGGGTGAY